MAEKNDAAKNIAEIMSGGGARRREGFSVYNKIYEFGSMVQVTGARTAVISVCAIVARTASACAASDF